MRFTVTLTPAAEADLVRLAGFLAEHSAPAAMRAGETIKAALRGLQTMPLRTRARPDGLHELSIRFGAGAYVVQYRVDADAVIVARIFHSREQR